MAPRTLVHVIVLFLSCSQLYALTIEIDGSPFSTRNAPIAEKIKMSSEKIIIIYPKQHFWGAYRAGRLVRWGIASAGADYCRDIRKNCRTHIGYYRIYSLGNESCTSKKYPLPDGGAPMPYCLFFSEGQAIHGSDQVSFDNMSHGCVRIHMNDAKWLRYHFVEAPKASNHYQGTKIIIEPYE